ncbi:MAG: glycosyltransferase family 2 protein [Eubacteriales bacterium]|nr:glycosyltransferase family 2 protein [Eubacteriales bacterium]
MVTISLCMIVKDEEAVLGRCLDSVRDVADEIVIVDTGSQDRTKEIAEEYTDKVYDFPWQDDFAAARNFSFSRAAMDYCMWLDADDILRDREEEKLLDWKKKADGSVDAVMLKYVTGMDDEGQPTFSYYRERLLKRSRGFRFEGCVHEAVTVFGKIEHLDISVEHHKVKAGDSDRNLRIYQSMRHRGVKFGPREIYYFARELYYHMMYVEAVDKFREFLDFRDAFVENQVEACRMAAYCCYKLGQEKEALDFLLRGLCYRIPSGELCCDLGKHFLDRQLWEQAAFWYEAALRVPKKDKAGGFILEDCYGYLPCLQLSVCYYKMGNIARARSYHESAGKWKPNGREYLRNKVYFR